LNWSLQIRGSSTSVFLRQISNPVILVVLYASDLDKKLEEVIQAGGEILKPIYEFPCGKRFHFLDPNGNELAIWSE
jgi:uncharacterized protein